MTSAKPARPRRERVDNGITRAAALLRWHEDAMRLLPAVDPTPLRHAARLAHDGVEREMLREALRRAGGSRSAAARLLGMDGSSFRRLLRKHPDVAASVPAADA